MNLYSASPCLFILGVISTFLFQIDYVAADPETHGPVTKCPNNFEQVEGYCYKLNRLRQTWKELIEKYPTGEVIAAVNTAEEIRVASEYLRANMQGERLLVWAENTEMMMENRDKCSALTPPDYKTWQMFPCDSELYSLTTSTSNIMTMNFITIVGSTLCIAARLMTFSLI